MVKRAVTTARRYKPTTTKETALAQNQNPNYNQANYNQEFKTQQLKLLPEKDQIHPSLLRDKSDIEIICIKTRTLRSNAMGDLRSLKFHYIN